MQKISLQFDVRKFLLALTSFTGYNHHTRSFVWLPPPPPPKKKSKNEKPWLGVSMCIYVVLDTLNLTYIKVRGGGNQTKDPV